MTAVVKLTRRYLAQKFYESQMNDGHARGQENTKKLKNFEKCDKNH